MKTATPQTHEQKLEQVLSYVERNYIEPYKLVKSEQLTEAVNAKIELAYTIKHIINSL